MKIEISLSTLELLTSLLKQVNVPASADNFDELAADVSLAKKELNAAIAEQEGVTPLYS